MPFDNSVLLVGNTTRDAELRFTPSGSAVASFGMACNRKWTDRNTKEEKEQTSFFDVTMWGMLAENVAASIARGTRIVVTGRLEQQQWETDNGEKRSKVVVIADEVSPSLRYATCSISKNERRGPDEYSYNQAPRQGEPF